MSNPGLIRGVGGPAFGSLATPNGTPDYGSSLTYRRDGYSATQPQSDIYNDRRSSSPNLRCAAGRAGTGGAPVHILCKGDSTTGGQIVGDVYNYPVQLASVLDRDMTFGRCRKGLLSVSSTTVNESLGNLVTTNFTAWSWTPSYNVTKFVLWYLTSPPTGASTFTYAVDGGSTTTVNTTGTSNSITSVVVSAGSLGSHTIALAHVTGTASYLYAVEAYDDTIAWGAKVTRHGVSGSTSARMPTTPVFNNGDCYLTAPDIVLLNYGINNAGGRGFANLVLDLKSEYDLAVTKSCDILHIVPNPLGGVLGDGTYGPHDRIRQAVYQAAELTGAPLIDIERRWSELTAAQRITMGADSHPQSPGYNDIARFCASTLATLAGARA